MPLRKASKVNTKNLLIIVVSLGKESILLQGEVPPCSSVKTTISVRLVPRDLFSVNHILLHLNSCQSTGRTKVHSYGSDIPVLPLNQGGKQFSFVSTARVQIVSHCSINKSESINRLTQQKELQAHHALVYSTVILIYSKDPKQKQSTCS